MVHLAQDVGPTRRQSDYQRSVVVAIDSPEITSSTRRFCRRPAGVLRFVVLSLPWCFVLGLALTALLTNIIPLADRALGLEFLGHPLRVRSGRDPQSFPRYGRRAVRRRAHPPSRLITGEHHAALP